MMRMIIRTATREDLLETVKIYLECQRSDYACKPRAYLDAKNAAGELAECEQWLYDSGKPNRVFVAMEGQIMAGYIAVGPNIGRPFNRDGEVCGFYVRKAYRRIGIGLRLLKAGVTYLIGLGYMKVAIFNFHISEANQFYRRLGGEVVWQEIQSPGGVPFEVDVFGYDLATLLSTLDGRLAKYGLL